MAADGSMRVRFWGVRGSIPAPGGATSRFGGNTSCVEVRCGSQLLVFDLGSGVRQLGASCAAPFSAAIFLSHYHYDHVQGLPFFGPIFDPRNRFAIYGPTREGQDVQQIISGQMRRPYFPVSAEAVFRAKVDYWPMAEGQKVELGEATVTALELNHPGGNLAYRVDCEGKSVVYATDVEHGSNGDPRLDEFAKGVDLLIFDAMYTEDEYLGHFGPSKAGWGHSTWQAAVDAANRAGAKKLALFHHEPSRDDLELARMVRLVRKQRPEAFAARESQVIAL